MIAKRRTLLLFLSLATLASCFVSPSTPTRRSSIFHVVSASASEQDSAIIFDFAKNSTVSCFERIDDVIMGGISSSSIRSSSGYATWSGVCRTDGGGFCGARTRTFEKALNVGSSSAGFYLKARLVSDDEPQRRVWKISTRTEESRGEELYQAEFLLPSAEKNKDEWSRIEIPFDTFKRVRGARFVPGGSKMDVSKGIYQIGLTMSKFVMAENMTAIENFRDGYFELQIKEIGLTSTTAADSSVATPRTLSEDEVKKKRSLLLKMLIPIAKVFFSEQSQRRKSAMKILREKRGMSRASAILFGLKVRSGNPVRSMMQSVKIVAVDSFRSVFGSILRYGLFYPLRLVSRLVKALKGKPTKKA